MKRYRYSDGRYRSKESAICTFVMALGFIYSIYAFVITPKPQTVNQKIYASGIVDQVEMLPASQQGYSYDGILTDEEQIKLGVKVVAEVKSDERIKKIYSYLLDYGSPIPELSTEIVEASDEFGLDPYIITAIFCQESSCGKVCVNGNCTGYGITDSGQVGDYAGMRSMIQAYATDWGGYYKNCGTDIVCVSQKYNPRESWVNNITWFYGEITK